MSAFSTIWKLIGLGLGGSSLDVAEPVFLHLQWELETSRDNKYKFLSKRAITNYFNPTQWWFSIIFQILAHIERSPEYILSFNFRSLMFLLALEMAPILALCSPVTLKLRPGPQRFVSGITLMSFAPLCLQFILYSCHQDYLPKCDIFCLWAT